MYSWLLRVGLVLCVCCVGITSVSAADKILVVGDSISAGFGLKAGEGWVSLLEKRLSAASGGVQVVNASVSGDTSAGGLARLPKLLEQHQPSIVLIELGGNDGLRGLPITKMKQNLARMIELSRAQGAKVGLLGMQMPANLGANYTHHFTEAFDSLSQEYQPAYVPFLLVGIWDQEELMQDDRIHPNAVAQSKLLANVWPVIEQLVDK